MQCYVKYLAYLTIYIYVFNFINAQSKCKACEPNYEIEKQCYNLQRVAISLFSDYSIFTKMSRKNYYFIEKSVKEFRDNTQKSVISENEKLINENSSSSSVDADNLTETDFVSMPGTSAKSSKNFVAVPGTSTESSIDINEVTNDYMSDSEKASSDDTISDAGNSSFSLSETYTDTGSDKNAEESTESIQTNVSLSQSLKEWAIQNNITHTAVNSLLKLMHKFHPQLPLDARTLLDTKTCDIEKITDTSEFAYFGVEKTLTSLLEQEIKLIDDTVRLNIHFDGIPIYKSSSVSFWPILCSIHGTSSLLFAIAIYYTDKKPDINIYLQKFCLEMKELMAIGIKVKNKIYKIKLRAFIADAPAKSFVKQIKQHRGYYACSHCTVKGIYNRELKAMSYNEVNSSLRTDESFRNNEQPQHHIRKSPLEQLDIDMVNSFPFDYMHLVLLGVMRKLINIWLNKLPHKISSNCKAIINDGLLKSRGFLPLEFHRRPRGLNHIDR